MLSRLAIALLLLSELAAKLAYLVVTYSGA
jgi:hypothetical protein